MRGEECVQLCIYVWMCVSVCGVRGFSESNMETALHLRAAASQREAEEETAS